MFWKFYYWFIACFIAPFIKHEQQESTRDRLSEVLKALISDLDEIHDLTISPFDERLRITVEAKFRNYRQVISALVTIKQLLLEAMEKPSDTVYLDHDDIVISNRTTIRITLAEFFNETMPDHDDLLSKVTEIKTLYDSLIVLRDDEDLYLTYCHRMLIPVFNQIKSYVKTIGELYERI